MLPRYSSEIKMFVFSLYANNFLAFSPFGIGQIVITTILYIKLENVYLSKNICENLNFGTVHAVAKVVHWRVIRLVWNCFGFHFLILHYSRHFLPFPLYVFFYMNFVTK